MANKVASLLAKAAVALCLRVIAFLVIAMSALPVAAAEPQLPPALANLSQQPPVATPSAIPAPPSIVSSAPTGPPVLPDSNAAQAWAANNTPPPLASGGPVPLAPLTTPTGPSTFHSPLTYEESKQAMLDIVPKPTQAPPPDADAAFDSLLQQNMPMSPQQVVVLRQQVDTAQRAASITPVIPPKPVSTTLMINLAPGTTPPAIRLAQGYVSSLVFVDSTGAPWPISQFDIGTPKSVTLQWDGKSNIILIQALTPYSVGDIVVRLVGLPTPITLELVAGQRVVDYRVDIHVSGIGPNTKELPIGSSLPNSANQLLLGILDGVGPSGSKLLTVRGADAQVWLLGQTMYLRTRFTLLSPGWIGKMVSPDGMNAYELPRTSSVLVSRYGEPVELKVEGL